MQERLFIPLYYIKRAWNWTSVVHSSSFVIRARSTCVNDEKHLSWKSTSGRGNWRECIRFFHSICCLSEGNNISMESSGKLPPSPKNAQMGFILMASLCTKLKGGVNGSVKFKWLGKSHISQAPAVRTTSTSVLNGVIASVERVNHIHMK